MLQTEGSTKKGGRPLGTGPRQREARDAANAVAEKVTAEMAKLRADIAAALDGHPALVAGITTGLTECTAWMERCEAIATRLGTQGGHDMAVLAQRLEDTRILLHGFAENARNQAQTVEAAQRRCDAHVASIAEAAADMIAQVRTQAARADDAARARHAEELAAIRKAEATGRRAETEMLAALAKAESCVSDSLKTAERNSAMRHEVLRADLASLGAVATPRAPSLQDDEEARKVAAGRATEGGFVVRERRDAANYPAQFVVETVLLNGQMRVNVKADGSHSVWVDRFLVVRTGAGWSPPDLADVADRAVAAIKRARQTNRGVATALRAVG